MITPKFAYDPGTGVVDFVPTFPPTDKTPYAPLEATRHDSITTSGRHKQSVLERIDTMLVLDFKTVPLSDMSDWSSFFSWVLAGHQFTYYPDSTDDAIFTEYTIEDMSWTPKRASFQVFAFSFKSRPVLSDIEHFS